MNEKSLVDFCLLMLSRVADRIYWMSRQMERAENMARLLDAGLRMALTRTASSAEEWNSVVVSAGCGIFEYSYRTPIVNVRALVARN